MIKILLVGFGGFLGAISRYLIQLAIPHSPNTFPWGTFIVNILGCFLIGLIYGLAERNDILNQQIRLMLAVGFCGSFTTFSTFAAENLNLIEQGSPSIAIYNALLSVIIGVPMVYFGITLTRL